MVTIFEERSFEFWTNSIGSIVTIAIFSFEAIPVVIGVLNFDAHETTAAWLETEQYAKEQFLKRAMIAHRVLRLILKAHKHISAIQYKLEGIDDGTDRASRQRKPNRNRSTIWSPFWCILARVTIWQV